jgi:hypothetical protein
MRQTVCTQAHAYGAPKHAGCFLRLPRPCHHAENIAGVDDAGVIRRWSALRPLHNAFEAIAYRVPETLG